MIPLLVLSVVAVVTADFDCICNYNSNYPVHDQPSDNTDTLGYLFEFDCKQKLTGMSTADYTAIAFDHMVGYIKTNGQTRSQMCPGDPSPDDIVTTTGMPSTTTYSTTMESTTPPMPTTYRPSESTTSSSFLPTTSTPPMPSTTTSGRPTTTGTAAPMSMEHTTPYMGVQTNRPIPKDQINLCSKTLQDAAKRYHYSLGQYNHTCYLLRPNVKSSWRQAENYCSSHGGHLFDISNAQEQDYIMSFLKNNNFKDEVWMGLQDRYNEERFRWSSGASLSYTNWYPYRKDDIDNHAVEDCAVLIPFAPFNGQWDDVHCGALLNIGNTAAHSHSYICQFRVHDQSIVIG